MNVEVVCVAENNIRKEFTGVQVHGMLSRFVREPRRSIFDEQGAQMIIQGSKTKFVIISLVEVRSFHSSVEVV